MSKDGDVYIIDGYLKMSVDFAGKYHQAYYDKTVKTPYFTLTERHPKTIGRSGLIPIGSE